MFRRRRRDADPADDIAELRDEVPDEPPADENGDPEDAPSPKTERPDGPYDIDEVDADEVGTSHLDFGGMRIRGAQGLKLQFQVDKRTGKAGSVLLGEGEAAVQLVAVAAPRSSGLWEKTRLEIAADAQRRGGSADEAKGPFGTELRVVVPVNRPDGTKAVQPTRVSGIDGPRWMLRATFLGKAITDAEAFARLVQIVKNVVIVRGSGPMAPGEVIALNPPQKKDADTGDATVTQTTSDDDGAGDTAGPTLTA